MPVGSGEGRLVGRTRSGGFQVGMRRTLPVSLDDAWRLVTSAQGARAWLGAGSAPRFARGESYALADGSGGEVRVVAPNSHLRLTWRPRGWARASTIQVRVIPAGERTTIALHQENLPSAAARDVRRAHFAAALDELGRLVAERTETAGAGG